MAVRKRGGRWHYDFMIRRVRYRGTLPEARTKVQAQRAENQVKEDVYNGRYGKPTGDSVFIEYAENKFLPWSRENKRSFTNDEYHVKTFKRFFGNKTFRQITKNLLEKFRSERMHGTTRYKRGRRPASVNRELQLLSKIFNRAIHDGLTDVNPCKEVGKLREDNKRNRYLLIEEEPKLIAALSGRRAHALSI